MTTIGKLEDTFEGMDNQVGRRVHHLMWDRRITQAQLGSALGTTQSTVAKKLRGLRSWSLDDLAQTASYLGVSMAYLLGEDNTPPAPRGPNVRPID